MMRRTILAVFAGAVVGLSALGVAWGQTRYHDAFRDTTILANTFFEGDLWLLNEFAIKLCEATATGTDCSILKGAASQAADVTYTWPASDGSASGDCLVTDSAGTLSFSSSCGAGGSGTAPKDASYITAASESGLTSERVLTEGVAIDLTDGGSSMTVAFDSTEVGTTTWGSGSVSIWTFDAGATTDPTLSFDSTVGPYIGLNETSPDTPLHITGNDDILTLQAQTGSSDRWIVLKNAGGTVHGRMGIDGTVMKLHTYFQNIELHPGTGGVSAQVARFSPASIIFTEDLSIQTGAVPASALDVGGDIETSGNVWIKNEGELRLYEATGSGTNYAAIKGAATQAGDVTYTWPAADGSSVNDCLVTDTAGGLSFSSTCGAASGAPVGAQYVTLAADATLTDERVLTAGTAIDITDAGAGSTVTVDFDSTEVGTTTWGAGSTVTWTFDAGTTDPTLTALDGGFFGLNNATPSAALDVTGDAEISADLTVDTTSLCVDSTNNRVGVGTCAPDEELHVSGDITVPGAGTNSQKFGPNTTASGLDSLALGKNANASNSEAHALGTDTIASGVNSVAVGSQATASGSSSFAMGLNANAGGSSSYAIGTSSAAPKNQAVAIGASSNANHIQGVAIGNAASTTTTGNFGVAIGASASAQNGNAIAIGQSAVASGSRSLTWGDSSTVSGAASIAIGGSNTITTSGTAVIGIGSAASHLTSLYIGGGITTTTPTTIKLRNHDASGTDVAGASMQIWAGASTGSGAGGTVSTWTTPAGASSSTLNAHVERQRWHSDGDVSIPGDVNIGGAVGTNPSTKLDVDGEANVSGVSGDGTGKVVCIKSDGNFGTCSDAPNGSGVCTCG